MKTISIAVIAMLAMVQVATASMVKCPNYSPNYAFDRTYALVDESILIAWKNKYQIRMSLWARSHGSGIRELFVRTNFTTTDKSQLGKQVGFWHEKMPTGFTSKQELVDPREWVFANADKSIADLEWDNGEMGILATEPIKNMRYADGVFSSYDEDGYAIGWNEKGALYYEIKHALERGLRFQFKIGDEIIDEGFTFRSALKSLRRWDRWIANGCFD